MADAPLDIPADLKNRNLELHVVCNSHLDREWTENFQFTRALTVKFLDNLLDIMSKVPEYQFLLDSQTVPLEDYLEIRPENEETLRQLVTAGRLSVGPWYTAPDFSCIFGESIVRNLIIGHRIARDFGKVMKIGYTPFGFGQVSQLPQIYAGFGIDILWFYRGVSDREVDGICFRWVGPDGTEAFCSRAQRYNYYFGVMRPVIKGGGLFDRDYDYTSTETPIHFCDGKRSLEHAILADAQSIDAIEKAPQLAVELAKTCAEQFPGDVISFMNGMDTSMPSILDDAAIKAIQAKIPENWKLFHSNLTDFVTAFRKEVEEKKIKIDTVRGERRDAGDPHREGGILGDIINSRPEQKRRNAEAEISLQRYAEPLSAMAWMLGEEYPTTYLDKAWKELCKCHPHDTIAGAGIDQIEKDIINRFDQVHTICETLMQFKMGEIVRQIDMSKVEENEIPIVVFNPSPYARSEDVHAHVDIPNAFEYDGLELFDAETGEQVECHTTSWRPRGQRVIRDIHDAPTSFYCIHAEIDFVASDIPALGYRTFIIRKATRKGWHRTLLNRPTTLENEFIRAKVKSDGTISLLDKETGRKYGGLHYFRDRGDAGNAWTSYPPMHDKVVTSGGSPARISIEHDSPLRATIKIEQTMEIPKTVIGNDDFTATWRTEETVTMPITSYVTLTRNGKALDIRTVIDNVAECHSLQVFFPTHLAATESTSDTPFDVVSRSIDRDDDHSYAQVVNPTHPCLRFADVSDGDAGLAIANVGIRGYEVTDNDARAIGLCLLRAFEVFLCTVSWRWERRPDQKLSQALGLHEMQYAIVPHTGNWQGKVVQEAERLNCPLLVVQTGRHKGTLPAAQSMLEITPSDVELSAIKKAENSDNLVVRVYNPTDKAQETKLKIFKKIAKARLLTLEEEPVEGGKLKANGGEVALNIGAKKIVTVELAWK